MMQLMKERDEYRDLAHVAEMKVEDLKAELAALKKERDAAVTRFVHMHSDRNKLKERCYVLNAMLIALKKDARTVALFFSSMPHNVALDPELNRILEATKGGSDAAA